MTFYLVPMQERGNEMELDAENSGEISSAISSVNIFPCILFVCFVLFVVNTLVSSLPESARGG